MCQAIPNNSILYLDGNRGVYIPRDFFSETIPECINWHCDDDTKAWILESCADPMHDNYWDAWNDAECYGKITVTDPSNGVEYQLYQDGDLWLVPVGADWEADD